MAPTSREKQAIADYLDRLKQATLYDLVEGEFKNPAGVAFATLLSTLGGNLQQQTANLLYPEDFFYRYQDAFPIMPADKRFYQTPQSYYDYDGSIRQDMLKEHVEKVYWDYWKNKLISSFTRTKPLFTPLFENYTKMVADFAKAEEASTDDYMRTDYPAPYGSLDQSYSTGAASNKGSTTRTGKGAENPDRLVKIKDFGRLTDLYWQFFDDLFVWGGVV